MSNPSSDRGIAADRALLWRGTVLNLVGFVLKNISPVLVIVLARVFDEATFGIYLSLHLFILSSSRLAVFGFDKGLTWRVPRNQRDGYPLHRGVYEAAWTAHGAALLAWGLAAIPIAFGALRWVPSLGDVSPAFVIIESASIIPYMGLHTFAAALEGARQPQYRVYVNQCAAAAGGPILSLVLHGIGLGPISLAIGYTAGNCLGVLLLLGGMRKYFPDASPWKLGWPDRALFSYSVPLGISEAIAAFLLRIDQWVVLLLLGGRMAAVYGVIGTLASGVKGIRQGYDPLIVAIVSRMGEATKGTLRSVYSYAVTMVTTLQMGVAVVVLFFASEILLVAGKNYVVEPQALSLLLASHLLNGLLSMSGNVIIGMGRTGIALVLNVCTLLLHLGLTMLLIPHFGIAGAAGANALSYLAQGIALQVVQQRLVGQHLYERYTWFSFLLVGLFCAVVLGWQYQILAWPLLHRAAVFAGTAGTLGLAFWLRRDTLRAGGPAVAGAAE